MGSQPGGSLLAPSRAAPDMDDALAVAEAISADPWVEKISVFGSVWRGDFEYLSQHVTASFENATLPQSKVGAAVTRIHA